MFYRPHERVYAKRELVNPKTGEVVVPPSRTKQSFRDECDINNILKHFKATGMLTHVSRKAAEGSYENLPDEADYQTSMNQVLRAQESFASLPSKIRARFNNDPAEFLSFITEPGNADELVSLGLAKKPIAEPIAEPIVDPIAAPEPKVSKNPK